MSISSVLARINAWDSTPWGIRIVRACSFVLLVTLTVAAALYGIFLIPSGPLINGVDTSFSWPFAVIGNLAIIRLTRHLDPWPWSPFVVAAVWIGVVLVLSAGRPPGDVIVPATTPGWGFLLAGVAAAVSGIVLDHRSRRKARRRAADLDLNR